MLHDIVHEMDPAERFRYGQLLAHLASSDRDVTRDEMAFFEQRLGATLLSPERRQQLRESLSVDLDLESLLSSMQPRTIKLALRDAWDVSLLLAVYNTVLHNHLHHHGKYNQPLMIDNIQQSSSTVWSNE